MAKPIYKYDLVALEDRLAEAYALVRDDDCERTKTDLFKAIRSLAEAVLNVGDWARFKLDLEVVAYEYSTYLWERIITGSFTPTYEGRFPWQEYVRQNLQHTVHKLRKDAGWEKLIAALATLPDTDIERLVVAGDGPERAVGRKDLAAELLDALHVHFSGAEVCRMLPLSMELILSGPRAFITDRMPDDIRYFSQVLVASAKRLSSEGGGLFYAVPEGDLRRVMASAVRSSVFLSAVANEELFPRELFLALDMDSLYRLVQVAGGTTIKIPYQRDFDSLLGAVVAVSKTVLDGQGTAAALSESKDNLGLVFSNQINLQTFTAKIIKTFSLFKEDEKTEPVVAMLLQSVRALDGALKQCLGRRAGGTVDEGLFKELSDTTAEFSERLARLGERAAAEA